MKINDLLNAFYFTLQEKRILSSNVKTLELTKDFDYVLREIRLEIWRRKIPL